MLTKNQEDSLNIYLNSFPLIGLIITALTAIITLFIFNYEINLDLIIYIMLPFLVHLFVYIVVKTIKKL